ncbi:MAG: hypothetical protein JNL77_07050 [Nitrosomonas sp.]|nr:hypothetical protein [Nitrosomonas sp.]
MQAGLSAFFGSQTLFLIQQLPNPALTGSKSAAEAQLASMMTAEIRSTTIPPEKSDARELYINLVQRNNVANPIQSPLQILRRRDDWLTTNAIPIPEIPSFAVRCKIVIDPNTINLLPNNDDYSIVFEFKTGDLRSTWPSGPFSSSIGSYRFATRILKGSSGLYFSTVGDNIAGSYGIYPPGENPQPGFIFCPFNSGAFPVNVGNIVRGETSNAVAEVRFSEMRIRSWGDTGKGVLILNEIKGQPFNFTDGEVLKVSSNNGLTWVTACTVPNFWSGQESKQLSVIEEKYRVNNTPGGSVPLGIPLQLEYRFVTPVGGRSDIETGISQGVMTNLITKEKLILCNFVGGLQIGSQRDPLTRLFPAEPYTSINSGSLPVGISHRISDLEIYSDYHIDMI